MFSFGFEISLSRFTTQQRKMDEEVQKRNTDCVYFLASPLTCKKGIECEYRHSEIARLNPRDCWYWMSGSCLNPTCGFRHPPLEKNAETPSEPTLVPPANKTSVPCYFFFNGFCKKGDRCLFSHGPDGNTSVSKTFKAASAVTDAVATVNKMVQDNGNASLQKMATVQHSRKAAKVEIDQKLEFNEDGQQRARKTVTERVPFLPIVGTQHEEPGASMSNSLHQENGLPPLGTFVPDQSFEEQVEDQVEPDDRLESSPGFDVLVNDRSENLVYDDDEEYLVSLERKQMDLNNGFLGYEYENEGEYEPQELMYESNMYDSFDFDDGVHAVDEVGNDFGCSEDRLFDSLTSRKRKNMSSIAQGVLDLRDHLNKRRTIDCHPLDESPRKGVFFYKNGQRCPERHRRRPISQRIHRRVSSEVRVNTSEALGDLNSFRRHYNGRRHWLSSEIQRKQFPREKESNEASAVFTGPKSLAQIKEEKKAAEENGVFAENNSIRMVSADFEGPKPLSEILKDKRRLDTWTEYCNGESSE